MRHKALAFVVMSGLAIVLATAFDMLLTGLPGWWLLAASWLLVVTANLHATWSTPTMRNAWVKLTLIAGAIFTFIAATAVTLPVLAAGFEPGGDWQRNLDLTPPVVARLREAMMSAYFAIAMIVIALTLFGIAYLLAKGPTHRRHAH